MRAHGGAITNANGLLALIALDARVAVRHRLVHVVVVLASAFGLLLGYAVPDQLTPASRDLVLDQTPDGRFTALVQTAAERSEDGHVYDDEAALRAALAEESDAIGIIFAGTPQAPQARVIRQGHESRDRVALMKTLTDALWAHQGGLERAPSHFVTVLTPEATKPPLGHALVPVLFALDVCLLGFIFGAVMMLQEKHSGTVGYFRITPGRVGAYLGAKLAVNLALVALNALILVGLAGPSLLAAPALLPLVLLGGAGMTLLGLGLAVYFRDLSSFFYAMAAIGLIAAVPMYPFFNPSIDLGWSALLPTHQVLFGSYAACFGGAPELVRNALLALAGFTLLSAGFAWFAVSTRLMKEAR